jgi:hypothetical protein
MAMNWFSSREKFRELAAKKCELADSTVIIRGRLQRRAHGPIEIPFGHTFADPDGVVVTISPNSFVQAGFIETVIRIEADKFTVDSLNAHPTSYYLNWIAIGR